MKYRPGKSIMIKDLAIPALYRMIMLAPSGSGKTNMAFHIIKSSPNVYAYLHVICRNPNQPLYNYLRDKLDGFVSFYVPDTAPTVDQIQRTPLASVIFDDITTDKHVLERLVSTFYIRCRHYKLSSILLAHSFFALPKMIRLNSELCVILKANSKRDLQSYTTTMASFVKIDSTNLVQDGLNSQWRYSFPGSAANFSDSVCAIQSISLYNSEFNIDSLAFANNTFKVEVPTAGTTSTISVNLPDGYFSYADINRYIQTALVSAGAYLIDASGNNVFFIQISENSIYYACQLDCSPTPIAIGTCTRPVTGLYSAGGSGLPTTTRVPRLIIDNASFGKNDYVVSGDILSAFDRDDAGIGQWIAYKPSQYA
ncbi:hypothetical protein P3T76_010452 [Phytophthora citrophthora]|uniref:Uncharacterized protein n=1 Tax=Phytophthora citrophthora TaxID=4793 RepID=A0AAD9GCC4_9STRA|nr:hypothetical protein P3T76_010452 [Phytophthora citrophthora]